MSFRAFDGIAVFYSEALLLSCKNRYSHLSASIFPDTESCGPHMYSLPLTIAANLSCQIVFISSSPSKTSPPTIPRTIRHRVTMNAKKTRKKLLLALPGQPRVRVRSPANQTLSPQNTPPANLRRRTTLPQSVGSSSAMLNM